MIQNLIFGIIFFDSSGRSSGHYQSFFFNFRFSSRKSQSKQKLVKKSLVLQYSFAQKASLILWTSTHLTLKLTCSRKRAKRLSHFTNFPENMFLFSVEKNICTKPFLDGQELHWSTWGTLKANVYIFQYISGERFLFQRRSTILSGECWFSLRWNNFLDLAHCLGLAKFFTIFHFSIAIPPSIAFKCWNCPDNLDFKGKTVVKFLIRSHFLSR